MELRLSDVIKPYIVDDGFSPLRRIVNRPITRWREDFDPLVDLGFESFSGSSSLDSLSGNILEIPISKGQSLILPENIDDPETEFTIEWGYHEWIRLPKSRAERSENLDVFGTEYEERRECDLIFSQYPSNWAYNKDKYIWMDKERYNGEFMWGSKGRFLIVRSPNMKKRAH